MEQTDRTGSPDLLRIGLADWRQGLLRGIGCQTSGVVLIAFGLGAEVVHFTRGEGMDICVFASEAADPAL